MIGRGTHLEETARRPAARLGLSERVIFAGYRSADYPDVLRASDVFTMLVPGSDGSCRALLEAAACGLPAVTTGLGSLPEIVVHGETGLVVAADPAPLAAAWRSLLESEPRAARAWARPRGGAPSAASPPRASRNRSRGCTRRPSQRVSPDPTFEERAEGGGGGWAAANGSPFLFSRSRATTQFCGVEERAVLRAGCALFRLCPPPAASLPRPAISDQVWAAAARAAAA